MLKEEQNIILFIVQDNFITLMYIIEIFIIFLNELS
jgi:hypothetical protein